MFHKIKKKLNIIKETEDNAIFKLYRNTIDSSGKYNVKFLAPLIVKGKIAFKISSLNEYANMFNNLIFPIDVITIFRVNNDNINVNCSKHY